LLARRPRKRLMRGKTKLNKDREEVTLRKEKANEVFLAENYKQTHKQPHTRKWKEEAGGGEQRC